VATESLNAQNCFEIKRKSSNYYTRGGSFLLPQYINPPYSCGSWMWEPFSTAFSLRGWHQWSALSYQTTCIC